MPRNQREERRITRGSLPEIGIQSFRHTVMARDGYSSALVRFAAAALEIP